MIGDDNIEFIKSLTDSSETPQDIVLQNEKSELLNRCIQKLPEKQRAALLLLLFSADADERNRKGPGLQRECSKKSFV